MPSWGYDGTVNEAEWAKMHRSPQTVAGPGECRISSAGGVRTVTMSPGTAQGHGITDVFESTITFSQPDPVPSGTRWDAAVIRRDWQPAGGTSTPRFVTGSSALAVPALQAQPGVIADHPLALVQFSAEQNSPTQIVDLRVTGTPVLKGSSLLTPAYPGGELDVAGRRYPGVVEGGVVRWGAPHQVSAGGVVRGITCNAQGFGVFAHGLAWTPQSVVLTAEGAIHAALQNDRSVTSAAVYFRVNRPDGSPFAGVLGGLHWAAFS